MAPKRPFSFKDLPGWLLYRLFVALLALLPLDAARGLLSGFFRFMGPLSGSSTRRMNASLSVAFPDQDEAWYRERRQRTWAHLGASVAESIKSEAVQRQLDTRVELTVEPEHGDSLQDPSGQLILTGHLGAWEVAIQLAPRLGRPVMGVHRPLANRMIEADLQRSRQKAGIEMVSIEDPNLMRRALKHLRAGGCVALFVDQRWRDGEPLELFGQPALCTLSPGMLALAGKARVSLLYAQRLADGRRHRISLEPLAHDAGEDDGWQDRGKAIMDAFNRRLETLVRANPDDWYWLQERWKP